MKISAISQFNHDDIELKPIERVYDGFFKINTYRFHHALFAGGKSALLILTSTIFIPNFSASLFTPS